MLALNVTDVPSQIPPGGVATIEIVGVTTEFMEIVMPALVTVFTVLHAALLVKSQVITSPFKGVASV